MISSAENSSQNHPKLIMMDQVYIIFDVDCEGHATEKVHISKVARVPLVAFRFQTNAPTRYIVSPKSGVLDNRNPLPVKIILHGNHYNPNHMLLVQAVEVKRKEDAKTIWDDPNLDCCDVQTIRFQLGTTIVSINKALGFDDTTKKVQASISQALLLSRRVGKEKVQELEDLLAMLRADKEILIHNIEQTERLKNVIKSQLKQRNDLAADFTSKTSKLKEECEKLNEEMAKNECELNNIYNNFRLDAPSSQ